MSSAATVFPQPEAAAPAATDLRQLQEDPWAEAARQLIRVATVNGAAPAGVNPGERRPEDYHQDLQHSRELLEQEFLYLQDNGLHPEFLKVLSQDNQPVQEHQAVLDSHYILEKMGEVPDGHGVLHLRKGISRSEKVLRSLGWEMQVDFEHLSETELVAPTYLDAILRVMHLKAGVRDDDEKRQAFKDVIHGAARRKDESLGQFATRRIRDFTKAATYGITLPPEFRVSLMKEGAGLSDQNLQNLAVLTQGKETDVDFLAAVMARMDVRTDRLSGYAAGEDPSSVTFAEGVNEESSFENHESEGEDSIDDEVILAELEDLNFSEDQAQMVFAILENRPPRRRRTWKENKMFKAEARKDRRPFRKGDSAPEGGRASGGRAGLSRDQLKKISTCRNCGRKGHWAEDCQQPKSGGQGGDRGRVSGFCYLGHPVPGGSGFCGLTSSEWRQIVSAAKSVTDIEVPEMLTFLTLKSGTAILDIGATQDLIGECALSALSHVLAKAGLKYIEVPVDSQGPPTGIGGAATVTRAVLVPISPGGVPGVVHFTVIKENVPPLLSVGLLEHLGATLDLVSNEVHFQSINVVQPMQKEASGHRTIPLVEWDGSCFPVPKEARERFGLSEDSFMLTSKSKLSSAYAKQSEAPGDLHSVHVAFGCRKPHDMKLDSSQSRKLSLCQPFVESRLDRVQPSSSGELIRPEREHPVALSAAFGPMSRSLAEQRWRALVNRLFFMMETTRMMYVRLVMAEKGQKSVKSDRRTYIESANQAPGKCLHAGPRINRGNQYASWQVCKVCNARINYASRGRSKAKPKAKASGAAVVTSTTSARTQGPIFEPNPRKNTPLEAPPTATSSSSTTSPEVATALQMMAAGFQQLNSTMAELMKGQSQMIMMMANAAPSKPFDQMTFDETSKMAAQATTEHFAMNVDEEDDENGSWSPVAPQVATLDDRGPLGLVLWHELRDGNGQVQARGPGEPRWEDSGECHQARYWVIDEKMAHLFYMHDNSIGVYGMNAKGEESPCGPFWHFSAELLEEHELGEAAVAVHNDGEEALRRLAGLARGRSRELQQNHIDILEVFHAGAFSAMAQQNGLKVLECPTRYSKEKGWSGLESKERRQLRQALRDYRPRLVAMRLESVEDYSPGKPRPSEVSRIKESVQGALALEIAEAQLDHNSYFLLEAPRTSELWKSDRMSRLLALPDLAVIPGEFGTQLITNDLGISQNLMSTARGKLSSEELPKRGKPCASHETSAAPAPHKTNKVFRKAETMAGVLLRRGDFSHQACRRLLKSIPWKELPLGKSGTSPLARERRCTVTLGQFTHGGVGGITRATELIPEATRFFNRYLTLQGATGPRSSLTIGINSCLSYRRDVHNVGMNSTIALGQFSGGQVWVEDPEGSDWREISPDRWMRGSLGGTGVQSAGIRGHGLPPTSPRPRPPGFLHSKNYNFVEAGEDTDGEHDNEGETTTETQGEHRPRLRVSEEQKKLIRKLHINTGHPPMERFLRTMRAAGALPHVLEYIRDHFKCDDCEIKVRADSRRRAQCPRLYTFNRVLSVDIMYLRFQERQVPIMNMVCTGTNYHVAVRVPGSNGTPSSSSTWKTFLETWVRYIGAPSLVISDGGNEFKGAFERGLEQLGCLQHVCAAESPWQNAKSERHGGWLKRRLTQEVESGRCIFDSLDELDEFLAQITAAKNRWWNQGGHSPVQLVFGELPRVSAELLSDGPGGLQPLADSLHDSAGGDEVGAEFRRRMAIRDRARQLAMENDSKEAIQKAIKTTTSPTRRWNIGQWVYVFRRAKPGDSLHPTSRWVGPGLVIMNSQGIVWVAMRTRLWRCTSEQLRPAFPSEVLGSHLSSDPELAELLRKVTSNTRAGAVDVAREGPPPGSGDEQAPVQQIVPDGLPVDEPQATQRAEPALPPGEMPGAPESFLPVPPGLVGPQGAPLPEMDPHLHGGVHSTATSRRSSVEEPAQEPEVPAPLDPIAEESSPGDTAERQEPPRKAPRTEEGTRAPGTPIHQLLRVIRSRRDQPESSRPAEASPREASRSPRREDPDHSLLTWFSFNTEGELNFLAKRNDEISLKDLN
ncbi:unnamed protein product, partial [Symbiodinium sp. KB8]